MLIEERVFREPIKIEVLYASENIVVALVEGTVYVRDDSTYMHPVTIPVGDSYVFMNFENVRKMGVQTSIVYDVNGAPTRTLPDQQFDRALQSHIPCLPDDKSRCRGEEYYEIWKIVHDVFETELNEAQEKARQDFILMETKLLDEKIQRYCAGEISKEAFVKWAQSEMNFTIDEYDKLMELLDAVPVDENGFAKE